MVGTGFTGTTDVKLGDVTIEVVGVSDTQLTVTIPDGARAGDTSLVVATTHGVVTTPFTITEPDDDEGSAGHQASEGPEGASAPM